MNLHDDRFQEELKELCKRYDVRISIINSQCVVLTAAYTKSYSHSVHRTVTKRRDNLTDEEVIGIYQEIIDLVPYKLISMKYNVSRSTIQKIRAREYHTAVLDQHFPNMNFGKR